MTLVKKYSQNSLPSFIDNSINRDSMKWSNSYFSNTTLPAVNVRENTDKFEIEVVAPGMKKDDFKIDFENNRLIISSVPKVIKAEGTETYTRREYRFQSVLSSFTIRENVVNGNEISTTYTNGVLSIQLPKYIREKSRPHH